MKQKGFTLIELLVVISIIGMIASVATIAFSSARAKGRDARRQEDIRQLKNALELYYDKNGGYPLDTVGNWDKSCAGVDDLSTLVTSGFIAKVPCDPLNTGGETDGSGYGYHFDPADFGSVFCNATTCPAFDLFTNLEKGGQFQVRGP